MVQWGMLQQTIAAVNSFYQ